MAERGTECVFYLLKSFGKTLGISVQLIQLSSIQKFN